jgi:hypothetical protein
MHVLTRATRGNIAGDSILFVLIVFWITGTALSSGKENNYDPKDNFEKGF